MKLAILFAAALGVGVLSTPDAMAVRETWPHRAAMSDAFQIGSRVSASHRRATAAAIGHDRP